MASLKSELLQRDLWYVIFESDIVFSFVMQTGNVLTELSSVQHYFYMTIKHCGYSRDRTQIIDVYAYWKMEI